MDARKADFSRFDHGSAVAALISGPKLGICKSCEVRFATTAYWRKGDTWEKWARLGERVLAQLVAVLDEIKREKHEGRAVVTMSFEIGPKYGLVGFYETFRKLSPPTNTSSFVPSRRRENIPDMGAVTDDLLKLLDDASTVLVCAAGNDDKVPTKYPAVFGNPAHDKGKRNKHIANLIIVAASKPETHKAEFSNYAPWITTFAPGDKVWVP
jgi:hypothetical protein